MLKGKLVATLVLGALLLTGCGAKEEATKGFTGTETVEVAAAKEGEKTVVEGTFENGQVKELNIEYMLAEGPKSEKSAAGEYVMKEGEENAWHEQVDLLEKFLVENNLDTSKVNLTNDKGNTDSITGVSIKVGEYLEAVNKLVETVNAK